MLYLVVYHLSLSLRKLTNFWFQAKSSHLNSYSAETAMISDLISLFHSLFVSRENKFYLSWKLHSKPVQTKLVFSFSFSPLVGISSPPLVVLFGVGFGYFEIGIAYLPFMVRLVGSETRRIENKRKKTDFMGVEKWEDKIWAKIK